jgi:hypothetical protein
MSIDMHETTEDINRKLTSEVYLDSLSEKIRDDLVSKNLSIDLSIEAIISEMSAESGVISQHLEVIQEFTNTSRNNQVTSLDHKLDQGQSSLKVSSGNTKYHNEDNIESSSLHGLGLFEYFSIGLVITIAIMIFNKAN